MVDGEEVQLHVTLRVTMECRSNSLINVLWTARQNPKLLINPEYPSAVSNSILSPSGIKQCQILINTPFCDI